MAALNPVPNSSGWNNSPVTVSFTCTAGTLPIGNCPGPQTASTEGAAQVVTGTVTDTAGDSGTANGSVNIDMTPPVLVVSAPADMSTFSQAAVTITGTASDALSGTALVTCGGVTATLVASAFTCNVTLNVGLNLFVIKATDAAGNVSASKLHLGLTGTLPAPTTLTVTPSGVNMLVGGTQQFTAIDQLGLARTDASWTVSDTTLATITTDSSPLLTAVAAGQVKLTATVGSVTGQTIVNILSGSSLPAGTVLWSAPPPAGFTVQQILQAAPSISSPDAYSVATSGGTCLVTGLTAGQPLWTAQVAITGRFGCEGVPDGGGGLLVETGGETVANYTFATHITDLDGQTGAQVWRTDYTSGQSQPPDLTVGQDGTVYYTGWMNSTTWGLIALAPDTGISRIVYSPPQGVETYPSCSGQTSQTFPGATYMADPVIGTDGTVFTALMVGNLSDGNPDCVPPIPAGSQETLSLVQLSPNGSLTVTPFNTDNNLHVGGEWPNYYPTLVIPDGQGGALVGWWYFAYTNSNASQSYVTDVTSSGTTSISIPNPPIEMVLGNNGLAYANDGDIITAFNIAGGSSAWTYQAPANSQIMNIISSSTGGGLVVKNEDRSGNDTVVRLDPTGAATADTWTSTQVDYFIGDIYLGALLGTPAAFSAAPIDESSAPGTRPRGDPQHNGTTDPGLVLVATQDCHTNPYGIYYRWPSYQLRLPTNLSQQPTCDITTGKGGGCYTVFEYIPNQESYCGVGGYNFVSPCTYAPGTTGESVPYNEFDDVISTQSLVSGGFQRRQYFLYGLASQKRFYGVKQIYMTYPDYTPRLKQPPSWNDLTAVPGQDPLIDGVPDPWLAPWDGTSGSCNQRGSIY